MCLIMKTNRTNTNNDLAAFSRETWYQNITQSWIFLQQEMMQVTLELLHMQTSSQITTTNIPMLKFF